MEIVGHNLNICANIADGVVINLRHLNSVFVKDDRSAVVIGGGAKWAEVYSYIDAIGLSTSGGRAAEVGVGGLSTGGKLVISTPVGVRLRDTARSLEPQIVHFDESPMYFKSQS